MKNLLENGHIKHGQKKQATLNIRKAEQKTKSGWCCECPSEQNS